VRAISCLALALAVSSPVARPCHGDARPAQHFVYFNLERERIREASFIQATAVAGAALKYTWRELEPERGVYAFAPLLADLAFLAQHGKRLVVQVQDVTFDERPAVPDWLLADPACGGGMAQKWEAPGDDDARAVFAGWVARRWDPAVRAHFAALLAALGRAVDGHVEAIVLPETSVDFGASGKLYPAGFTPDAYAAGVRATMASARRAFQRTTVIQYANFMPGEWLPWEDRGYLRSVYACAESLGVGVGGPDVLPHRKGQRRHSYPLIASRGAGVRAALAVQDGNLGESNPRTRGRVTVAEIASFACGSLRADYVLWGTEEPYYSRDVLPFLRGK